MALSVCFYFQVHQPWRLARYRHADIGNRHDYFDAEANARLMQRVAEKCYLPMNALLLERIHALAPDFRVSFSITATALEQMQAYAPQALESFRALTATGAVELLAETSHHTLAGLYSEDEFAAQVARHRAVCETLLGVSPGPVFRNTELITSNAIAQQVQALGFRALCLEGTDALFGPAPQLARFAAAPALVALPRHYRLSDDIAFRFSDRQWACWPLTAERFAEWVGQLSAGTGEQGFLGLFMDYETFGEHQWADTGIFDFMRALPDMLIANPYVRFKTASECLSLTSDALPAVDLPQPMSWADLERDTSAWTGNRIQRDAGAAAWALEPAIKRHAHRHCDPSARALVEDWRRLLTSDHVYYMSTKHWADGDVHKYFSPFESPYDAYINYMNVLADLERRSDA